MVVIVDEFLLGASVDVAGLAQESQLLDDGRTRWACVCVELNQLCSGVDDHHSTGHRGSFRRLRLGGRARGVSSSRGDQ